ncbi:DNA-binding NtrC family response regulator [Methylobacter tundripaludum]|jgi:DNA-binding NtrC family response regulator|uniref:DNA-binding NtrC family response regulator n=1 Tax=Methylobacter tundripaludum TaxID=173365 RepID=A0A2S6HGD2_9GAMM|nr:sigma-54 dependent transcriptional regulator [Methylobacter tundripaludum]PPK76453.1 DNA-binding NtrC family response regulator [Methylobacter tundripaludum]
MIETLLIIEDEKLLGSELSRHYRQSGWEVALATNLSEARELLLKKKIEPLLILSDMNLPDGNALDFMEKVRKDISYTDDSKDRGGMASGRNVERREQLPRTMPGAYAEWLFLTGYGNVPDSVRALRLGAYDFLEKPCDLERLDLLVASAARSASIQRRVADQTKHRHRRYSPDAYVGHSQQAQGIRQLLAKLTQVPFSALIIGGESGTGKGLAARILHYGGSRAQQPMIEVNCAALPRELLESELFGHEPGAFTGAAGRHRGLLEQADGGTLFMDEIGEMPLDLQAKLLKVIEDHKVRRLGGEKEIQVDVQIVAASNRDLEKMAQDGSFRADLYHRLSVFKLILPPLREAVEDLDELVPLFVAEYNAKAGRQVKDIPDAVWSKLKAHYWPGNVRELRNVIERCVLFSDGSTFPGQWLQLPGQPSVEALQTEQGIWLPLDGSMALDDMDCFIIKTALERADNNLTAAARALGATRETLRYRVRKYNLKIAD